MKVLLIFLFFVAAVVVAIPRPQRGNFDDFDSYREALRTWVEQEAAERAKQGKLTLRTQLTILFNSRTTTHGSNDDAKTKDDIKTKDNIEIKVGVRIEIGVRIGVGQYGARPGRCVSRLLQKEQ